MLLRYFYNQKLAQASYMVGCQSMGVAIVIDPSRNIDFYLDEAESEGLRIIAVTETHIHADYVSGARELAERTGARLYLSDEGDENWKYLYLDGYDHQLLKDGDTFKVGNILFEAMHTPGHTPEHMAYVLTDTAAANRPMGIFTGDFVFVGSIGRPDLLEKAAKIAGTAEVGARQMFDSVQRFKQLPDYLQVWPGHGAGSACGKGLGAIPSSTVGYEKLFNAALNHDDPDQFVEALLAGQPEPPAYFAMMKRVNKEGPAVLGGLKVPTHLPLDRLQPLLDSGALVVDTRLCASFANAHVAGTINIPYNNSFINWAGWLIDYDQPFYLVAESANVESIVHDLAEIGLDQVGGYFEASAIEAANDAGEALQHYEISDPEEIVDRVLAGEVTVVDVSNEEEWHAGHLPGARHIMLGYLAERAGEIPTDKPIVLNCAGGMRSAIGVSLLQAQGIVNVINLNGGLNGWRSANLEVARN